MDFSLESFAAHLVTLIAEEAEAEHVALDRAARVVEKEAKKELGHYQEQAGPFVPWQELADSTQADRVAQGYTPDDPGRRSGDMADSIEHTVAGHEAHVGSDDQHMEWFELGTEKQPPRSALGGAAFRKAHEVRDVIGEDTVAFLSGKGVHGGKMPI